ncbi:MAG: TIGR03826 family flagellar region protein [Halanaerobiaceae bacterium]
MALRNCADCGRLFADDGVHKLCDRCRQDEEAEFKKVKEYLWDHPNAGVNKVSEETEVDKELIIKFVKENRIIADGFDLEGQLHCERCGTSISSGRYCEECRQKLVNGFSSSKKKNRQNKEIKEKRKGSREMHIKDRINQRKDK